LFVINKLAKTKEAKEAQAKKAATKRRFCCPCSTTTATAAI